METNTFNQLMLTLEFTINKLQKIAEQRRDDVDMYCRDDRGILDINMYMRASTVIDLIKGMTATKNAIDYLSEELFKE